MGFAIMKHLGIILTGFILCNNVVVRCEPRVKLLHVVFRHGEKVPHAEFQNYPNDPYRNHSYYPLASGGLTNEGKMREFKIGEMLRKRYDNFFGSTYWPEAVYARSTKLTRAKMSLQLVLAGLFPPVGQQNWNSNLAWQPVDTLFDPLDADLMFTPQSCHLWKNEFEELLEDKEIGLLINEHKATMEYLAEHSGKKIDTPEAVYYLYNLFREQKMQNLTLPEWTREVYPYPMKNITILHFKLRSYNEKLRRFSGGFILAKFIEDMKNLVAGRLVPHERKAFFYSGHENDVVGLAYTLGTREPKLPDYGSTIIIETLEDGSKHFVRVLLWTGVTERLITQNIPGCSEICPLEKFIRLLNNVIPDDTERKCNVTSSAAISSMQYVHLIISILLPIIVANNVASIIA